MGEKLAGAGWSFLAMEPRKKIGYESNLELCDYTFSLPVTLLAFLGRHAVYIVIS